MLWIFISEKCEFIHVFGCLLYKRFPYFILILKWWHEHIKSMYFYEGFRNAFIDAFPSITYLHYSMVHDELLFSQYHAS